ncbi:MAG: nitrous oxide reductase accessory protein NosL [Bacteroidota bacterium]
MKTNLFLAVFIAFLFTAACQTQKEDKSIEQEAETPVEVVENFDCSHCGMPSKDFPKWNTTMKAEESVKMTCSPRCMFLIDRNGEIQVEPSTVVDYFTTQPIDAKSAFYVAKSDVTGPMGHDFVPFDSKEAAEDFQKDHGGEVYAYDAVTMEVVESVINFSSTK